MSGELLRIVDALHRDRNIPKEVILQGIEQALLSALRKRFGPVAELTIEIDRATAEIRAKAEGRDIDPNELGRIAAQSAKQVMIQKIREAERDVIFTDFETQRRDIAFGTITRIEGPNIIVNLGKAEGFLPRKEQIPDEPYNLGDRLRFYVVDVKKSGQKVKIILSRSHPDLIRRLFELEVPEITDGIIEIKALVRESGYRTKVAVSSSDSKVDSVGACVGVRGSRIKTIIDELGGEKIDIIRWSDSAETLIANALKPAQIRQIELDEAHTRALVIVDEDQLSLAIGKKGQNVRLASRLSKWEIDILTEDEVKEKKNRIFAEFQLCPLIRPEDTQALYDADYNSLAEIAERGLEALSAVPGFGEKRAAEVLEAITNLARESIRARKEAEQAGAGAEGAAPPAAAAGAAEGGEPGKAPAPAGEAGSAAPPAPPGPPAAAVEPLPGESAPKEAPAAEPPAPAPPPPGPDAGAAPEGKAELSAGPDRPEQPEGGQT